jgi:hypothetical protein
VSLKPGCRTPGTCRFGSRETVSITGLPPLPAARPRSTRRCRR